MIAFSLCCSVRALSTHVSLNLVSSIEVHEITFDVNEICLKFEIHLFFHPFKKNELL